MRGSAKLPYVIKNVGGAYACTCPAWRNQGGGPERRTCKHIRALRGDEAETARMGTPTARAAAAVKTPSGDVVPPPILLAHRWEGDVDLTGWWLSEKLDGVRAYWDGQRFVSRLGNTFVAPAWFTAGLPAIPLDGELWCGRKAFQKTVSIVRREDGAEAWRTVRYVVFDAPDATTPFEARIDRVRALLTGAGLPHVEVHAHQRCEGTAHLERELARVEALGGEGLMLRQPGSRYEVGRSTSLLKVKSFQDAEAKVIDHLAGTGRHQGRLGALQVELVNGTRFSVGTGFSDREREDPPPLGTIVTVRYQELSDGGVPRFPSFVGVRVDADWGGVAEAKTRRVAPGAEGTKQAPAVASPRPTPAAAPPAAAPPPQPAAPSSLPGAHAPKRYFELRDDDSAKFWELALDGAQHVVRYGKIGSAGQMRLKTFASPAAASADAAKLIAEKTGKGYREV